MKDSVKKLIPELTQLRRRLHAEMAELSMEEHKTAEFVLSYLVEHTSAEVNRIASTGVIALIDSGRPGPAVLLRADLDALPISEELDIPHRSKNDGVSHKCGHDGHTTIMLGVARILDKTSIKKGKVYLLWQPSEENGMGASAVLADPYFKNISINQVFALHNLPGLRAGCIALKSGSFTSHVESLIIHLKGKTAHAAEPEQGINPAICVPAILERAAAMTHNRPEDEADFFLITPVYIRVGSPDYGIAAGDAELHFTIRAWHTDKFKADCATFLEFIRDQALKNDIGCEHEWTQRFPANQNDQGSVELLKSVCEEELLDYEMLEYGNKWGEDFGLFTQRFSGAMFGIGSGENCPALHHPDYDFPDHIMSDAIRLFSGVTLKILHA